MALTLLQYAAYLDSRDLPWPAPPKVERPKAKPFLVRLPEVRVVLWNVYGSLLAIAGGELLLEHPQQFIMDAALDKTIQEFKMWGSMSRKPGQPAEYMRSIYDQVLIEQRSLPIGATRSPEVAADRVWEAIIKKLLQKDYRWDTGFYGSLNELSRKVAYFFHASLQGTACYRGAALALRHVHEAGLAQGLLADGQCFTTVQLQRALLPQDPKADLDTWVPADLRTLSWERLARKPSERLFRHALELLHERGIGPDQVLHVGSRIPLDILPAKRLGMKTALFAGDKAALQATPEHLRDPAGRPDVLLTKLKQIADVVG
jgi:hypothetical protein